MIRWYEHYAGAGILSNHLRYSASYLDKLHSLDITEFICSQ